jgi:hypothetical protein
MRIKLRFTPAEFVEHHTCIEAILRDNASHVIDGDYTLTYTMGLEPADVALAFASLVAIAEVNNHVTKREGVDEVKDLLRELLYRLEQI